MAPVADIPPCCTLYLRNLPSKLPPKTLRSLLHALASPHGAVIWISAAKTVKLRGQAFVTFADLAGATAALRELNGASFLGSVISASYAREVSDRVAGDGGEAKRRRKREKAAVAKEQGKQDTEMKVGGEGGGEGGVGDEDGDVGMGDVVKARAEGNVAEPNRILFAEGLPAGATSGRADVLGDLFGRFGGFVEVRTVPGRRDIAFVEFGTEAEAAVALSGLQGLVVGNEGGQGIVLSYAKK